MGCAAGVEQCDEQFLDASLQGLLVQQAREAQNARFVAQDAVEPDRVLDHPHSQIVVGDAAPFGAQRIDVVDQIVGMHRAVDDVGE